MYRKWAAKAVYFLWQSNKEFLIFLEEEELALAEQKCLEEEPNRIETFGEAVNASWTEAFWRSSES